MVFIKNITLDFNADSEPQTIMAKQKDTESRFILITPVIDGKQIDMTDITAVFCAEKPDGKHIVNNCEITEDGNIFLELTSQTLAVSGVVKCEIKLYQDLAVLSSCMFCLYVLKSVDDDGFESTDEYTVLTKLINMCKTLLKDANLDIETRIKSALQCEETVTENKNYEVKSE